MNKCEIMAIFNQKGGVGKTTTTFNLGVALANKGKKVLLVDTDPQGDLTTCMGWHDYEELTIADLMQKAILDIPIHYEDYILHHKENVDLIPSNLDLSTMEVSLINTMSREFVLKKSLEDLKSKYDYILIDCQPSLGMLTINSLAVADNVIIPVQSQYLSLKNMGQLLETIYKVKRQLNPKLYVNGALLTLVDKGTNMAKQTAEKLESSYGSYVNIFDSTIPKATKVAESTASGSSIFVYDKSNKVAESYNNLAKEVIDIGNERVRNETTKSTKDAVR